MNDSLSIILPLRNAETTVARQISRLLELVPDLTSRFEIVVVDDGSRDHTAELVREWSREYPQLRLVRHVEPRGRDAAIQTGLAWSQGQTVFVQEDQEPVSPTDLVRLWSLRHEREVVMARSAPAPGLFDAGLLERLTSWGQALRNHARGHGCGALSMIRRQAAETIAADEIDDAELAIETLPGRTEGRGDAAHAVPARRKSGPSVLQHLRERAAGE